MHMTPRSVPPRPEMLASLDIVLEFLKEFDSKVEPVQDSEDLNGHTGMQRPLLADRDESRTYESTSSTIATQQGGWDQVVLAGHSYGTFVAGWIIRQIVDIHSLHASSDGSPMPTPQTHEESLANKIAHTILIDPIPILLSNPTVAHNFLYREPSTVCPHRLGSINVEAAAEVIDNLIDVEIAPPPRSVPTTPVSPTSSFYSSAAAWQLWYFASRDADVARTLFRTFFWTEGGIWREEIETFLLGGRTGSQSESSDTSGLPFKRRQMGRNMAVVLGGMDQVIPSEAVRRHLTQEERWRERWTGKAVVDVGGRLDIQPVVPSSNHSRAEGVDLGHNQESHEYGKLEVLFNPKLDHAVIFDEEKWLVPLLDVVRRYVRDV